MDKEAAQEKLIDDYAGRYSLIEVPQPPEVLFHYTSNEILVKVIHGRNLWMTHALNMNDSAEFAHGMMKFKAELDTLELKGVDKGWLDRIREFFDKEMKRPLAEPFVFSMTEEADQLSQWRGYGDGCRGVSAGLKTAELISIGDLHLQCLSVIYDHDLQDKIVKSAMEGFIALIRSMDGQMLNDSATWGPKLALGYFQVSYLQSIRFKHKSWQEEREWRAVRIAGEKDPRASLKTRGSELIRYYDLVVPNIQKLIAKIVIGPKSDKVTQRMSLEAIRSSGGFNFEIEESRIPMRS